MRIDIHSDNILLDIIDNLRIGFMHGQIDSSRYYLFTVSNRENRHYGRALSIGLNKLYNGDIVHTVVTRFEKDTRTI